jgi:hypothetical protein
MERIRIRKPKPRRRVRTSADAELVIDLGRAPTRGSDLLHELEELIRDIEVVLETEREV